MRVFTNPPHPQPPNPQFYFSRAAERDLGYPSQRRRQAKQEFDSTPHVQQLRQFLKLESSFHLKHMLLTSWLGRLKPCIANAWFYDWHNMEEAEHCWDRCAST